MTHNVSGLCFQAAFGASIAVDQPLPNLTHITKLHLTTKPPISFKCWNSFLFS